MKNKQEILDSIQNSILKQCAEHNLRNEEAAALLTSVMRNVMAQEPTATKFKELGFEVKDMNAEIVTKTQLTWTLSYIEGQQNER